MKDTTSNQKLNFSLFCWNIANPSIERAAKQAQWLRKRTEDILALTETKTSEGCLFLEKYFRAYGYNVLFPKPEGKEFGVMLISKNILVPSDFSNSIDHLQSRVASVKINLRGNNIEIINIYVPSRNTSYEKIEKKKRFLQKLIKTFKLNAGATKRIFCGDFNVLEPNHKPHYPFFEKWEYGFYQNLTKFQLEDAFRHLNPSAKEYSWVGRTGDGYRYDHCFVSKNLLPQLKNCYYFHETRKMKLSDHSALIAEFSLLKNK